MKSTPSLELIGQSITVRARRRIRPSCWIVFLLLGTSLRMNATDLSVAGGFQPGQFTWLSQMQVSGAGFTPTVPYLISIYGPLDLPGVPPADRALQTLFADGSGNLSGTVNIPYRDLATVNAALTRIPRPGHYQVRTTGPGNVIVGTFINLAPQTMPVFIFSQNINWGKSRGGRDGWLDDKSPERTDPEWMSVWDERPVALYATVAETDTAGENQPDIISHHEVPASHYGHDANLLLIPDPDYRWLLGTANYEGDPAGHDTGRIELEWELQNSDRSVQGSYGTGNIGLPLWADAASGDRVYTVGRWAMDHGHLEHGDRSEIHPPRLLATMRKFHTVVPLAPAGCMTRASQVDIYVSGHGGGSNNFYDSLSAALNDNGRGGGRIEDVMDINAAPAATLSLNTYYTYYGFGPSDSSIVDALKLYKSIVVDVEPHVAGPSGMAFNSSGQPVRRDDPAAVSAAWNQGPEERLVNDMGYDFDVPLPPAPPDATAIQVQISTHPEHTTSVNQVITYTNPDAVTHLPTTAHIHLPYNHADNGIYGRTLKFYWNTYSAPGRHFVVTMNEVIFFYPQSFSGKTYLWVDVCGQRIFLTDLNPQRFLDGKATLGTNGLEAAKFDVYLDPTEKLRLFAYGFDQQPIDDFFGVDVGISAYEGALHILGAYIDGQVSLNPNNGDSESLGGVIYEASPIPLPPLAGGVLGRHDRNSDPFYYDLGFTVSYVPDPRVEVTDAEVDFGRVCVNTSVDRVIRISNAAVGLQNNDPYANAGVDVLNVNLALTGPGLSFVPASTPTTLSIPAGQHQDVTVRFSPTSATQVPGSLMVTSNDACHPALTVPFCGESVPTGIRILVVQPNGTPYTLVDRLTLNGDGVPRPPLNLRNVTLNTLNSAACGSTIFHYQTALPPSTINKKGVASIYDLRARVGNKNARVTFTLGNCEFKDIIITP